MSNRAVTVIPPTINTLARMPLAPTAKRRVAGYARVSTDSKEQMTSYKTQVDYYTRYIQDQPAWEFVGVYTDADTFYGLIPKSPSTSDFSVVHGLLFGLFGYRVLN